MQFLSKYDSEILTAAVVVFWCVLAFFAYNSLFPPEPKDVTKHTEEIARLRAQLAASSAQKDADFQAYQDSMQLLQTVIDLMQQDSVAQSDIQIKYNDIRAKHQSLQVDSAVALARYRLRIEASQRARFNYRIMSN